MKCPKCGAKNLEAASPTITLEQGGRLFCSMCAHDWPGVPAGLGPSPPEILSGADLAMYPLRRPAKGAA
jgi:hypothetical protein